MTRAVVVVGDVGARDVFHLGDEAMLEAALTEVDRRLDVRWTVVSAHPAESAARYGAQAVDRLGFGVLTTPAQRERRLAAVLAAASGGPALPSGDPAWAAIDAVAAADAVLVAGGGNLSSGWPEHVYERAALCAVAAARGVPVVVSGQGLGPQLTARDGELVAGALTGAWFVGVRERASADTARRLGVPPARLWCAADDAAFLPDEPRPELLAALGLRPGRFVAATFGEYGGLTPTDALVGQLAALIDAVAETTGLEVVLVPHLTADGADAHDTGMHERLTAAVKSDHVTICGPLPSRVTAWLTGQAALVVAGRYHPLVLGLARGVPAVGVCVDDYTEQKIHGALDLVGLGSWAVAGLTLSGDTAAAAVEECWQRRDELATHLRDQVTALRVHKAAYWDAVVRALDGHPEPGSGRPLPRAAEVPAQGGWTVLNGHARVWTRQFSAELSVLRRRPAEDEDRLAAVVTALQQERSERARAQDRMAELETDLVVERAAGDVARRAAAGALDARFDTMRGAAADAAVELEALRREYGVLQQTKLLRWTRTARAVYGAARRWGRP